MLQLISWENKLVIYTKNKTLNKPPCPSTSNEQDTPSSNTQH